ncbi:MAG TPA: HAD family hydrolase [Candidatus Saccharimonadales bacterium]|nr:HAD family hydrolase [Candidatus Saccharimonadales bacterium]
MPIEQAVADANSAGFQRPVRRPSCDDRRRGSEMAVRVAAVIADLDGTIVRSDFSISPATVEALATLRAGGVRFVVATARTPQGLAYLGVPADRTDIAVCCSGSIGWSMQHQAAIWMEMVPEHAVRRVVDIAESEGAGAASFDGVYWRMTAEYARLSPTQPHGTTRILVTADELADAPCCTMALRNAANDLKHIAELVASEADTGALSHVGRSTVLDVTRQGVDKGTGTVRALAELGLEPHTAVSFGDMPNDIALFRATGRSYSVGAVHPDVVNAADEVVDDVEHDGFAQKISALSAAGWETG